MIVHRRVTPGIQFAATHLCTWVESGTVRVKCIAQEIRCSQPGLEPRPHNPESSALTMRPPRHRATHSYVAVMIDFPTRSQSKQTNQRTNTNTNNNDTKTLFYLFAQFQLSDGSCSSSLTECNLLVSHLALARFIRSFLNP